MRICSIKDCNKKHYAKGYCNNHYALFLRKGNPIPRKYYQKGIKCRAKGCELLSTTLGFCCKHYTRFLHYGDYNIAHKPYFRKTSWVGYKKQNLMRDNRLIKISQTKGKCELCDKQGKHIHHKDGSTTNHSIDNLIFLCCRCHCKLHPKKTSKFIRLYGLTLKELSVKLNLPTNKVYLLHKENQLSQYLNKQ